MKPHSPDQLPIWVWILLAASLFTQSLCLFIDARKRESHPWFWGLWGLIQFPMPTLFYLIFVVKIFRKK